MISPTIAVKPFYLIHQPSGMLLCLPSALQAEQNYKLHKMYYTSRRGLHLHLLSISLSIKFVTGKQSNVFLYSLKLFQRDFSKP